MSDASAYLQYLPQSAIARRYRTLQGLVVDYAIGLAILGLNPFRNILTPVLIVALAILLKMVWNIWKKWHFPKSSSLIVILGGLGNLLGCFTMALMAWLSFTFLGAFVPVMGRFGLSAALMTLAWTLGAAANQTCLNATLIQQTEEDVAHG